MCRERGDLAGPVGFEPTTYGVLEQCKVWG
jgi:hypothetical protein